MVDITWLLLLWWCDDEAVEHCWSDGVVLMRTHDRGATRVVDAGVEHSHVCLPHVAGINLCVKVVASGCKQASNEGGYVSE